MTSLFVLAFAFCVAFPPASSGEESAVVVHLDAAKAAPRAVESLTERAILRDYRAAWRSMADAFASNNLGSLNGLFAGEAKQQLQQSITGQEKSGVTQRYLNQNHQLEAVFYAPEGDVIELHDTADYQQQVRDGAKSLLDGPVTMHYIVLMTPSTDRWVIRQLQAVEHF